MKGQWKSNLPAALLVLAVLMLWQWGAMGMDAQYILPSPVQILQRLWELREPLFLAHLPATMGVVGIGLVISVGHLPPYHRLADHSHHRPCAPVCAVVWVQHLEQGAGDGADDLFPHHHHRV